MVKVMAPSCITSIGERLCPHPKFCKADYTFKHTHHMQKNDISQGLGFVYKVEHVVHSPYIPNDITYHEIFLLPKLKGKLMGHEHPLSQPIPWQ